MALMRHRRYDVGATWAGWGWIPEVFPPGMAERETGGVGWESGGQRERAREVQER
jgi:hypothetical protein